MCVCIYIYFCCNAWEKELYCLEEYIYIHYIYKKNKQYDFFGRTAASVSKVKALAWPSSFFCSSSLIGQVSNHISLFAITIWLSDTVMQTHGCSSDVVHDVRYYMPELCQCSPCVISMQTAGLPALMQLLVTSAASRCYHTFAIL